MSYVEVYYFSGTGNSLHVARELQKRIPEIKLIPIVSLLNKDIIEINAKAFGFVFPTYLTTVPAPVRIFLDRITMKSPEYVFSITTLIGYMGFANIYVEKALKKKGVALNLAFMLNMASNTPAGLMSSADKNWTDKITREKIIKLEYEVQKKLDYISERITNKENHIKKGPFSFFNYFLAGILSNMSKDMKKEIPFYADSSCTGCGTCEKVCISGKVKIRDKKPVWAKDVQCYYCYACFNFCSVQSVLIDKIYTEKKGRYYYPGINANDIGQQKENNNQTCQ